MVSHENALGNCQTASQKQKDGKGQTQLTTSYISKVQEMAQEGTDRPKLQGVGETDRRGRNIFLILTSQKLEAKRKGAVLNVILIMPTFLAS